MKESFENKMSNRFREALENYQVQYDQRAWERLSKEMPSRQVSPWKRWKFVQWWLGGILVAGLIMYGYLSTYKPEIINQSSQNSVFLSEKKADNQSSMNAGNTLPASPFVQNKKTSGESLSKVVGSALSPSQSMLNSSQQRSKSVLYTKNLERASGEEILPKIIEGKIVGRIGPGDHPTTHEQLTELPAMEIETTTKNKHKVGFKFPEINLDFSKNPNSHFVGPNKISIYYNPEFQMEKTLRNPGLVHGLGVEFEGPINPKINLAVGINYFSKQYSGSETFRLDSSKVSGLHVPFVDSTVTRTGKYQFLEMPVTLRFNLYSGQRSSLFFDGGFSVIAFLNQEYNTHTVVNLEETDNNIKQKAWKNIHPLGSLNLGLTYRYALSERFSIGASVEYKNHLSGLGALPMKLNRFSGRVGVVYRFGRKDEN